MGPPPTQNLVEERWDKNGWKLVIFSGEMINSNNGNM